MTDNTIGSWAPAQLLRFVLGAIRNAPANIPVSLKLQKVTVTETLRVEKDWEFTDIALRHLKDKLGLP